MSKSNTSKKSATASRSSESTTHDDAIQLLTADHRKVKALFNEFNRLAEQASETDERTQLARRICAMLTVHATIEEEIFYPAAREALEEQDLLDEAEVEHASAKELIAQIESMSGDDELFDAKVKVLGEYIDHHVREEEGEMFPKCQAAGIDLEELGTELSERKIALMGELGIEAEA